MRGTAGNECVNKGQGLIMEGLVGMVGNFGKMQEGASERFSQRF